jgi:hypothetical protein
MNREVKEARFIIFDGIQTGMLRLRSLDDDLEHNARLAKAFVAVWRAKHRTCVARTQIKSMEMYALVERLPTGADVSVEEAFLEQERLYQLEFPQPFRPYGIIEIHWLYELSKKLVIPRS